MGKLNLALTFDDITLKTRHSNVMPCDVSLETKFSRNISLKIPIVSAAMDTVTEHRLAIELAKLGGIGVIHRNLTAKEQSYEVARVKNHLNGLTGLIENPVCVYEDETIESILHKIDKKDYPFNSFPVINRERKLVGILTGHDFNFCDNNSLCAKDVMTKKIITEKGGTSLYDAYNLMKKVKKKILPLVNDSGEIIGLYAFKDLVEIKSGISSSYNIDKKGQLMVAAAIGVGKDVHNRLEKLVLENVDVIVIDTAHGDSKNVINTLRYIKKNYVDLDVVVGNISEAESARRLIEAGADGIKVGQGPGSICTTRVVAGIGCPQITAIYNCSGVADKYSVPLCADGGLRFSGDITKAIGAGAHSVMMGNMLAGIEETPGETISDERGLWKKYRGMGSIEAMRSHKGSRERYKQNSLEKDKLVPEGVSSLVPYKGKLSNVITQYIGGLRSGMGYVGASTIEELREKADFYKISSAGQIESHPHDIKIIGEDYEGE
ncbi:MAG: IMP dehydrogenase [Nanoarchaeota archaeon]|nr:IMP dehydrogenase [Nanoarchaeota archaeon]